MLTLLFGCFNFVFNNNLKTIQKKMKAIKIMSIISLVLVVGTLGFALWSHFSTKKNQEEAKLKYTDVDFEEITA